MVEIDLALPHSYGIEHLLELPGTGGFEDTVLFFPRPKTRPEHDGLWIRVRPASGKSWIGVFGFGYQSPPAISRVVSSFDRESVCVVSSGAAYIVNADEPDKWDQIPAMPVRDVRSISEQQLLVFADFSRLVAFGPNGLAWQSPQLCWDDLTILTVTHDCIEGVGFDPTNSASKMPFAVDIKTGRSLNPPPISIEGKLVW